MSYQQQNLHQHCYHLKVNFHITLLLLTLFPSRDRTPRSSADLGPGRVWGLYHPGGRTAHTGGPPPHTPCAAGSLPQPCRLATADTTPHALHCHAVCVCACAQENSPIRIRSAKSFQYLSLTVHRIHHNSTLGTEVTCL